MPESFVWCPGGGCGAPVPRVCPTMLLQLSMLHAAALLRLPSQQSKVSFDNPARPGVGAATWHALRRPSLPALGFSNQHLLVPGERLKFLTTSPAHAASISRSISDF